MNPTLSVIIPIYKVEDYLERCVNSVLTQDYDDFEIILVDDGSPDKCPQMCDELSRKDNRIKVIHKLNGGLSSARNTGIGIAKGKYLAFLDSDDQWIEGRLKEVMTHTAKEEFDMIVFDAIDLYEGNVRRKRNNYGFFDQEFLSLDALDYYEKIINNGNFRESACTKIINHHFLVENKLEFTQGITGEDSEWMMRLLRCANRIAISNVELFLCTCARPGSIQNSIKPKNLYDIVKTVDKSIAYYKVHSDAPTKQYELEQCAYLVANATGLLRYIDDKKEKRELIQMLKQRAYLFKFSTNRKTGKVRIVYELLGFDFLVGILEIYMFLKKKNILNHKRKISG